MSAKWLRQKYTRRFAGMDKYPMRIAGLITFGYVAQILGAVAAGAYLLSLTFGWATPVAALALMIFVATRFRGLNNIIHECSHATFTRVRSHNTLIGKFCAVLLFSSFMDYRDEHLTHHAHLGDYDHDHDLQGIKDLKLHEPLSARVILRHLVTPFLGRHLPYYLHLDLTARDGKVSLLLKLLVLTSVAFCLVLFPVTTILFLVLPFTLLYSALNYWTDCLDHGGIVASGDDLDASRNILAPHLIRYLFFPRNDCFHLVHHLFPHVPARLLEASHKLLELDDVYNSRPNAVPRKTLAERLPADTLIPAE
ncbi:fatty acid desaturase [Puniceibacterium sp. IMCC21224]|uniref:fatty acid desaturase family protein n=1 Tax=Puniceibacterium sp. IMCC21224 TaxID=1618204 RepID=UPI00065D7C16|nr:fatty acid desaturase [Puniceibacterium sp. IMCC21224]KMK64813.1 fatty acid desaturase [Puniceibacterium sp. IMCC21224]